MIEIKIIDNADVLFNKIMDMRDNINVYKQCPSVDVYDFSEPIYEEIDNIDIAMKNNQITLKLYISIRYTDCGDRLDKYELFIDYRSENNVGTISFKAKTKEQRKLILKLFKENHII